MSDPSSSAFTGSTKVFNEIWRSVAGNLEKYRGYPRLVGETGGKDFVFVGPDAEAKTVATALIRSPFQWPGGAELDRAWTKSATPPNATGRPTMKGVRIGS